MVLTGVTLGLMYPWMHTALERYKVENTQFGDRPFTFDGAARNLFLPWLAAGSCCCRHPDFPIFGIAPHRSGILPDAHATKVCASKAILRAARFS